MDKNLMVAEQASYRDQANQNLAQVYICLDVMAYLITILPSRQIAPTVRCCQRGIAACLACSNSNVVRSLYGLLTRLLASLTVTTHGIEDLDQLSNYIIKFVGDTLTSYEKVSTSPVASLYGAMTVLKAMCTAQPLVLDRILPQFVKALQKLSREHTTPLAQESVKSAADIISLCIDLLRPRMQGMSNDLRKTVCQQILIPLVEKSSSARVVAAIAKIADEWIRSNDALSDVSTSTVHQHTSVSLIREKHSLLVKLQQNLAKRFKGGDQELHRLFLTTVLFVYSSSSAQSADASAGTALKTTGDICARLEPAFHAGLSNDDRSLSEQFFAVMNDSVSKSAYDRLFYIVCTQNWEPVKRHHWLRQCSMLLLQGSDRNWGLQLVDGPVFDLGLTRHKTSTPPAVDATIKQEDKMDVDTDGAASNENNLIQLRNMVDKQRKFLEEVSKVEFGDFASALSSLCNCDDDLADKVWMGLFPSIWKQLTDKQREILTNEVVPFLASGNHIAQKDAKQSCLKVFVESFALCQPKISIKPNLLKYLGKNHNLWHRAILLLEDVSIGIAPFIFHPENLGPNNEMHQEKLECLDSIAELYKNLSESDLLCSVWRRRAGKETTRKALAYSQHGQYSKAAEVLEAAMNTTEQQLSASPNTTAGPAAVTPSLVPEMKLWEQEWIRCTKYLNQWGALKSFANSDHIRDPLLLVESAWRIPEWPLMNKALNQLDACCAPENVWLSHLYRGYLLVFTGNVASGGTGGASSPDNTADQQHVSSTPTTVDKCVELANARLIATWRKLPTLVSHSHVGILQAAQRVQELCEASQVSLTAGGGAGGGGVAALLADVKSVVKTWRNRAPTISDSLTYWYDVFGWRLHHYLDIVKVLETTSTSGDLSVGAAVSSQQQQQGLLIPIHSCAQCITQLAKVARKQNLVEVSLELLNKLHTMPNLPPMDGYAKLYQQVKCFLKIAEISPKPHDVQEALFEGLDVIESANIGYFNKEQSGRLYTLKGTILSQLQKNEDASRAFSAALQMCDGLTRAWANWAEHLEGMFFNERSESSSGSQSTSSTDTNGANTPWKCGLNALVCLFEAARQDNEAKARKHLARSLWLMKALSSHRQCDRKQLSETVSTFGVLVPPFNWLTWLPQLLCQLTTFNGPEMATLVHHVATAFPQAAFPHLQRILGTPTRQPAPPSPIDWSAFATADDSLRAIRAQLLAQHPVNLTAMAAMLTQLESLSEHWSEQTVRAIRQVLAQAYARLFDNRADIHVCAVEPAMQTAIGDIVDALMDCGGQKDDGDNELRARIAEEMRRELLNGASAQQRLITVVPKLIKWQATLAARLAELPKTELLRAKSAFLSAFTSQSALLDIPGEYLSNKPGKYCAKIARFLPQLQLVRRPDSTVRRLCIRGHNGKETTRRLLQIDCPKMAPIGDSCCLVESSSSALSMSDIFHQVCLEQGVKGGGNELVWRYYERLTEGGATRTSHMQLRETLKEVSTSLLPKDSLKQWLSARFPDATSYFMFRKRVALGMSVTNLLEFVLHLGAVGLSQVFVQMDTAQLNTLQLHLDISEGGGVWGELDANRPVPFRLGPCVSEWLGWSLEGHLLPAMTAVARTLKQRHSLAYLLRPILWDCYRDWAQLEATSAGGGEKVDLKLVFSDEKRIVAAVNRAVSQHISTRLQNLSNFDKAESKMETLVTAAQSLDNLCRMDPSWHPWF